MSPGDACPLRVRFALQSKDQSPFAGLRFLRLMDQVGRCFASHLAVWTSCPEFRRGHSAAAGLPYKLVGQLALHQPQLEGRRRGNCLAAEPVAGTLRSSDTLGLRRLAGSFPAIWIDRKDRSDLLL